MDRRTRLLVASTLLKVAELLSPASTSVAIPRFHSEDAYPDFLEVIAKAHYAGTLLDLAEYALTGQLEEKLPGVVEKANKNQRYGPISEERLLQAALGGVEYMRKQQLSQRHTALLDEVEKVLNKALSKAQKKQLSS